MPITVNYNPSIALSGEVAYQSGRGKFLQSKDRFDYQKLNSDRTFAEGQRQFNQQQAYNVSLAQLKSRQFQQQLGQRDYQFDAGLDSREQLAQSGIDARFEQQRMRQEGQAEYQAGQAELQQKGIQAREKAALTAREQNVIQKQQEQQFDEGAKAAGLIEKYTFRKPDQKQQSIEGWERLYGRDYPYNLPVQESPELFSLDQAESQLESFWGNDFVPGMANMFGTVVDGEYIPDEKTRPSTQAWLDVKADEKKAAAAIDKELARKDTPEEQQAELDEKHQVARQKFHVDAIKEAMKPVPVTDGEPRSRSDAEMTSYIGRMMNAYDRSSSGSKDSEQTWFPTAHTLKEASTMPPNVGFIYKGRRFHKYPDGSFGLAQ